MQDLSKFSLPKGFRGRSGFLVQLWWLVQFFLFKPSPQFMYGWRRFLLRMFGASLGKNVIIRPSVTVQFPWKIRIGHNSWVGDDVVLYSLGEINIGNNVCISQKSYLCTGSHDYTCEDFAIFSKKIVIEDYCWIATDVYIAPGVTVGKGAVIGARSSVFKDVPSNKICMGSPLKIVKDRA